MNIAVIYSTMTGHSRKIAKAIANECKVEARDIKDHPTLSNVDVLFIVGGIYGGASSPKFIEYIKKLDATMVKKAVLITSSTGKVTKQDQVRETLIQQKIDVLPDEFTCQGSFLFFGWGHPNKVDLSNAVEFAKKIILQSK